ncbi:DUF1120 domain-containing protein [Kluyvera intermedia]|uniref:DUF1120 domain-containing protein n=1 Tax=Kluyvera intermedia TaxID=61648 RepID=UPI00372D7232
MKKTLIAAALMVCAGSAFADPTAVLQVQGKLTNAACTPELSNGGVIDYGYIHLSSLSADTINQIGHKQIDLKINCTAATKVAWSLVDDKASTIADITVENATATGQAHSTNSQLYGVGLAGDVKIGNYAMYVDPDNVIADSKTVDIIYRQYEDVWEKSNNGSTQGESIREMTVATTGSIEPLAFTNATFPLVTSLAIQSTSTLAITDDTELDGQLTISLNYL